MFGDTISVHESDQTIDSPKAAVQAAKKALLSTNFTSSTDQKLTKEFVELLNGPYVLLTFDTPLSLPIPRNKPSLTHAFFSIPAANRPMRIFGFEERGHLIILSKASGGDYMVLLSHLKNET